MQTSDQLALQRMLERAAEYQASDLHLTVGSPPILRIDTKLAPLTDFPVLTKDFLGGLVDVFLDDNQKKSFDAEREISFSYAFLKNSRFRVNLFYQRGVISASLRYIGGRIPTLHDLHLPESVESLVSHTRGLIIVDGPLGSGRSTTIAALVQQINLTRQEYILTIEQPVEYLFANNKSIVEQREVGRDTPSISHALESAAQEDVNVIMISNMDDPEVLRLALSLASSGRLVIGSLNVDTTAKAIEQVITAFPGTEQRRARIELSETLLGVICQRLVPRVGGGRIIVAEVLIANSAVRSVVREGNFSPLTNIIQTSREEGMVALDSALAQLIKTGEVRLEDALVFAEDRNTLAQITQAY